MRELISKRGLVFFIVFLYILFMITVFSVPRVDRVSSDAFFHVKMLPNVYWITLAFLLAGCLLPFYIKKAKHRSAACLTSLILFATLLVALPQTMYANFFPTDHYNHLAESFYVLEYGYAKWGSSPENPVICIFSSILTLVTGTQVFVVAKFFPMLVSLVFMLFVFLGARQSKDVKLPSLAVLAIFSFSWFIMYDYDLSKQAYGLLLQLLAWFLVLKKKPAKKKRWVILFIITYSSLVISHAASAIITSLSILCLLAYEWLIPLLHNPSKILKDNDRNTKQGNKIEKTKATFFLLTFALWSMWYGVIDPLGGGHLKDALLALEHAVNELLGRPSIIPHVESIFAPYRPEYAIVLSLRSAQTYLVIITGVIISSSILISKILKRDNNERVTNTQTLYALYFMSCILWIPFSLYAHRWIGKGYMFGIIPWSWLMAYTFSYKSSQKIISKVLLVAKTALPLVFVVSVFTFPLTSYAPLPFAYPPTTNLEMLDFVTGYGVGSGKVIGAHIDYHYYLLKNNACIIIEPEFKAILTKDGFSLEEALKFQLVATSFRAYTIGTNRLYDPPIGLSLDQFKKQLCERYVGFAKVYVADSWHEVFAQQ